jgi:chitinase
MDYGPDADPNGMGQNAISAATHALQQLRSTGVEAGVGMTSSGITIMLGRNDVSPEVFAQNDAQAVLNFAQSNPDVHLLSMWSVGRDRSCPGEAKIVSGTCSGITQQPYEFAHIFEKFE